MSSPRSIDAETAEDIILCARYGDLSDLQEYLSKFGGSAIASLRDERGNGCLHMAAGNGHLDILKLICDGYSQDELSAANTAGNTAIHWAALNAHLEALQFLVPKVPKSTLSIKNQFGRTPLIEAERGTGNNTKHEECAAFLLSVMEEETLKSQAQPKDKERSSSNDDDKDVVIGTVKMGSAAKNGEYEFVPSEAAVAAGITSLDLLDKDDNQKEA